MPEKLYAVYVNLGPKRKVRIHIRPCGNIRKNGKENAKHYWREFATLSEAIAYAESEARAHNLSPWTENNCHCNANLTPA